jgi:hypothetical protein
MPEMQPRRYSIPTHLNTPDTIDLPLFGITISLTMRQGVCFLLGGSLVFHLWQGSFGLTGLLGLLLHWIVPFLLAFATYIIAVHTIWGRHLEAWALLWWAYVMRPKVFAWCSVLESTMNPPQENEEDVTIGVTEEEEE